MTGQVPVLEPAGLSNSSSRASSRASRLCLSLAVVPTTGTPRAFDRAGRSMWM